MFDAARVPHGGRALVLRTPQDNRLYFVLPAGPRTIVGTTDTDFTPAESRERGPRVGDEIRARGADVAYLLEAARHAFPALGLGPDDVVSTYAGLRPLLAGNAHTPSETSREHDISRTIDGIIVVAGGKLTTLRRMAEETVDLVVDTLRARRRRTAIRALRDGHPPAARRRAPARRARRPGAPLRREDTARRRLRRRAPIACWRSPPNRPASASGSIRPCLISGPKSSTPPGTSARTR